MHVNPLDIPLYPVTSSNVAAVGYDEPTQTLVIRFHSGAMFAYEGVSNEKHVALLGAESIGGYVSMHIVGKDHGHKGKKIATKSEEPT